ncbi:Hsp33 family molecular chaperone [Bauldia sp.]|uniref:Hsp33 family molecular chaperone n=1 Tax=Bauldia sp. TaxID=2575872 RepID=UPI003BA905A4
MTTGGAQVLTPAGDDAVLPFEVAALDVRGRAVQMGPALDAILAGHSYPDSVSKLLGEALVLAVLLGTSLKFDGKFILQTETDGPVDMLVVDYHTDGGLRAYARFDAARVAAADELGTATPSALLGSGILAMTIDQGPHTSRYQGIVPLEGNSLEDVAHIYFRQSEQIPTRIRLAVAELHDRQDGVMSRKWRAGGVMIQFFPSSPERARTADLPGGDAPEGVETVEDVEEDDAWVEAQSLVGTIEDHELTDPAVPSERLLFRLFHEHGVRVFSSVAVVDRCSCSREKVAGLLRSFSEEEIADSIEDGRIAVTCEFCGKAYTFDPNDFSGAGGASP